MQDALRARDADPPEEDRAMLRRDAPGAPGDGVRSVEDREVDLRECGDPVEERGTVRRGLGKDGRDPDRRRVGGGCERTQQLCRLAVRALRQPAMAGAAGRDVGGKQGIEPRCLAQDRGASRSTSMPGEPGKSACGRGAHVCELALGRGVLRLERALELDERGRGVPDVVRRDAGAEPHLTGEQRPPWR